jgi:hypothetical protein
VYTSRVDSSPLVFSLSSHRHSYIGLVKLSLHRFIINNKSSSVKKTTKRPRKYLNQVLMDTSTVRLWRQDHTLIHHARKTLVY